MEAKKDIRKRVLETRSHLTDKEWEDRSHRIFEKVATHPFFLRAKEIYCYVDYRKEVGTRAIINHAWSVGKKVAVPKINETGMDFYYIQSFDELHEGYKGILEPNPLHPANGEDVLVIMPGAAFDQKCHRIGYGKGYYDRYLCLHPTHKTLALAFELQMMESIPKDDYDICPSIIITEENSYEQ